MTQIRITGLSLFQQVILYAKINWIKHASSVHIEFSDFISAKYQDSLWYGGDTVKIHYRGYTFHISAIGDIRARLYHKKYKDDIVFVKDKNKSSSFWVEMHRYLKNDRELKLAKEGKHRKYKLELIDSNWWECSITTPQGEWYDVLWCLDENNLLNAIPEVMAGMDEYIKALEDE